MENVIVIFKLSIVIRTITKILHGKVTARSDFPRYRDYYLNIRKHLKSLSQRIGVELSSSKLIAFLFGDFFLSLNENLVEIDGDTCKETY